MKKLIALALAAGLSSVAFAAPETYVIDNTHTYSRFAYSHFGYSTQESRFDSTNGKITIDRAAKTGSADITIDAKSVDTGYATLDFPFKEQPGPSLDIHKAWPLQALLGYVSTWSAVRRAQEAGQDALLHRFAEDLAELWGDPTTERSIRWPVNMRLGIV